MYRMPVRVLQPIHPPVRFVRPLPLAVVSNTRTGQQAEANANFFDALRAVTPTLIITGIAIGIASGLGSTIGTTLGTLIVSRFDRKQRR